MATMTTAAKLQWTDYAVLQPSVPQLNKHGEPVQWKVQVNQHGTFRCNCPAFIFSKAPKSCKHVRVCEHEKQSGILPAVPVQAVAKPTPQHPQWASAVGITKAMLDSSHVAVSTAQMHAMCEVLAAKLAAFVPARVPVKTTSHVDLGVRYITFDD